jgi:glycerol uptake facilitator-like aquaporin
MESEPRVYAAELLGTFVLVFVGTTLIHSRVVVPAPEAPTAPVAEVLGEDPERGR